MGSSSVLDAAVQAGPGPGNARGLVLPDGCVGLMVVGMLSFCQPSAQRDGQLDLDVQVVDADGRMAITKMSGFTAWPDGAVTDLGRMLQRGELSPLVGSEVAVIISQRVGKNGQVYTSPVRLFSLVRN